MLGESERCIARALAATLAAIRDFRSVEAEQTTHEEH
jgi:hypothetical protein